MKQLNSLKEDEEMIFQEKIDIDNPEIF